MKNRAMMILFVSWILGTFTVTVAQYAQEIVNEIFCSECNQYFESQKAYEAHKALVQKYHTHMTSCAPKIQRNVLFGSFVPKPIGPEKAGYLWYMNQNKHLYEEDNA